MTTETIDKLYLELSLVSRAKTAKEFNLEGQLLSLRHLLMDVCFVLSKYKCGDPVGDLIKIHDRCINFIEMHEGRNDK